MISILHKNKQECEKHRVEDCLLFERQSVQSDKPHKKRGKESTMLGECGQRGRDHLKLICDVNRKHQRNQ